MTTNTYGLQLAMLTPFNIHRPVDAVDAVDAEDPVNPVVAEDTEDVVEESDLLPSFERMPNELWLQVFENLNLREKIEAAGIVRNLRAILQSPAAWHTLDLRGINGTSRYNTAIARVISRCPNAIRHVFLPEANPINDCDGAMLLRQLLRANNTSLQTLTARIPLNGLSLALALPTLTSLRKLELLGDTNILRVKNYSFDVLRFPPSLEELTIRAASLPPLGHPHPVLRLSGRLRRLNLEIANAPFNLTLEVLAPFMNTLEQLQLTRCILRREPIRQHFFHQFTRLEEVQLSHCTVDMHGHLPGSLQTLELYGCHVTSATNAEWIGSDLPALSSFCLIHATGITWQDVADYLTDNRLDPPNRPTRQVPQHLETLKVFWPINNPPQAHMQFSLDEVRRMLILHGRNLRTLSFVDEDITEEITGELLRYTKPAYLRLGSIFFSANSIAGLIHEMSNTLQFV